MFSSVEIQQGESNNMSFESETVDILQLVYARKLNWKVQNN